MVQSLCVPTLCLLPVVTIVILMIWLLKTGSKKGHVCSLALLNIYSAKLKGRVLVILMEWLTHCQRLTGSLSGRLSD